MCLLLWLRLHCATTMVAQPIVFLFNAKLSGDLLKAKPVVQKLMPSNEKQKRV